MKLYKFILSSILIAVFLLSCKEDTLLTFNSESQIYFDYYTGDSDVLIRDSIDFSFIYEKTSLKDTIVQLQVIIMGDTAAVDRPFAYSVDSKSTAQEGVHYDISSAIIPAGKEKGSLEVRLYRTPDLENQKVSMFFKLEKNEYFSTDYTLHTYKDSIYNLTTFKIYSSDMVVRPVNWGVYQAYFGDFSVKKMRLIAEIVDIELIKFEKLTNFEMTAYGIALKRYLEEQKAAGTPVLEDDGSEMTAGTWAS